MAEMTIKSKERLPLIATLGPGDFPLGSPKSRAAARMNLANIRKAQRRVTSLVYVGRPHRDPMRYHFTDWAGDAKNGFTRAVFVPSKWLAPGDPVPVCPDCGKPFRKKQEALGQIFYVGDCVEVHAPERAKQRILGGQANLI
jgi:hypothetical protein